MTPARQQRPTLDDIIKELECQLGCSEMLFFDEDPKRHLDYTEEAYCELRDVCKQLILVLNASHTSTPAPAQPAQQRIDATIKELGEALKGASMYEIDEHIREAIALLREGEK